MDHQKKRGSKVMTKKADIVRMISVDYGLDEKIATGIYNSIVDMIAASLVNGEKVDMQDFCTLTTRRTKKRKGRNPFTGEKITIQPKNKISFKPKPSLKRLINPPKEK